MFKLLNDFSTSSPDVKCNYYHIYEHRLSHFQHRLLKSSSVWTVREKSPKIIHRVLDVINSPCIAIGTLYKNPPNRPNVLAQFELDANIAEDSVSTTLTPDQHRQTFFSLEDSSGSVSLKFEDPSIGDGLVSGVCLAVLGEESPDGEFFIVKDIRFPAPVPGSFPPPLPVSGSSKYIAFVSGLGLQDPDSDTALCHAFADFVSGLISNYFDISRIVVAGGLFQSKDNSSGHSAHLESVKGAKGVSVSDWLTKLAKSCQGRSKVDVIPGIFDPSPCSLPQPPFFKGLLPDIEGVFRCRNPYSLEYAPTSDQSYSVIGSSGQIIADMCRYSSLSPLDALKLCLDCGHIAPTAPDTLDMVPSSSDPLVLERIPRVLFSSGDSFASSNTKIETKTDEGTCQGDVSLFIVPHFQTSRSFVLLDLSSFETREVCIESLNY
ncbi:hypothetical protein P9112_011902 [Eukaryota sp. TZLM1-RC]